MSSLTDQHDPLLDFRTRFEALEKKLHERLLDTERGLRKCQRLIADASGYSFDEIAAQVDSWMMESVAIAALALNTTQPKTADSPSAADILRIQIASPDEGPISTFSAFQLAISYWLEADKSFRMGDYTRTLPAVIVSCHYLGMAGSPPSASEHQSDVMAKIHEDRTRLHRAEAIRLLNSLAERGGAKSISEMLKEIGQSFENFNKSLKKNWRSASPKEMLKDWCEREDRAPEVRKAWLAAKTAWKVANQVAPSKSKAPRKGNR
jgi:hypothetical protein